MVATLVEFSLLDKFLIAVLRTDVVIDDDTCLARIISSLQQLRIDESICSNFVVELINKNTYDFLLACSEILIKEKSVQPSVAIFTLKLFTLLSHESLLEKYSMEKFSTWKKSLDIILQTNISDAIYDASYQSAWLQTIAKLSSNQIALFRLLESEKISEKLIHFLGNSTSLFVANQALKTYCKLLVSLQQALKKNGANEKKLHLMSYLVAHATSSPSLCCKVLSECFRLNTTSTIPLMTSHFENFFSSNQHAIIKLCEDGDTSVHDFVTSYPTEPIIFLPQIFFHEIIQSSLNRFPLRVSTFNMLYRVAQINLESFDVYLQILMLPFHLVIGDSVNLSEEFLLSCKESFMKTWSSTSKTSALLSHCAHALRKILISGSNARQNEDNAIMLLVETLSCMNEVTGAHSAARFRQEKSSLAILDCLITLTERQTGCLECAYNKITNTLLHVCNHPDSNHQVLDKTGRLLLYHLQVSCSFHLNTFDVIENLLRKVEHPRWEDRDTAIELFKALFTTLNGKNEKLKSIILQHLEQVGVFATLIARVSDTNSFVRSSALLAMAAWITGISQEFTDDLFLSAKAAFDVINNDTEAVARRSAVRLVDGLTISVRVIQKEVLNNFLRSPSEITSCRSANSDNVDKIREFLCGFNDLLRKNLSSDLDWEVQGNIIDMLGNVFKCAQELTFDNKRHLESLSSKITFVVRPLVDSLDNAVSERAMDLLSRIDDNYDITIIQRRKVAMMIDEVNNLLRDVVYHANKDLPLEQQQEHVILDCY